MRGKITNNPQCKKLVTAYLWLIYFHNLKTFIYVFVVKKCKSFFKNYIRRIFAVLNEV